MKKHLIVKFCIGVSASGKSTWSKEFVKTNPSWVRIGRDDFRYALKDSGVCDNKIEGIITEQLNNTISACLNANLNVIIDNTNLKASYIEDIIEVVKYKADIEFKTFPILLHDAIERDSKRERTVGETVIRNQYKQYTSLLNTFDFNYRSIQKHVYKEPIFDINLPNAVVFDLDGTLFHHNDARSPFSWMEVDKDTVDSIISEQVKLHKQNGDTIIIVSGRDACCKELTEQCLKNNNIPYDYIFMRPENDHRKDSLIKEEIYNNHLKGKYNVKIVYDDRNQVVKVWRSLGLKCFQVEEGNF